MSESSKAVPPLNGFHIERLGLAKYRPPLFDGIIVRAEAGGGKRIEVIHADKVHYDQVLTFEQAAHLARLLAAADEVAVDSFWQRFGAVEWPSASAGVAPAPSKWAIWRGRIARRLSQWMGLC